MKIIEIQETVCAYCGENVQKEDLVKHILTCELQPLAVFKSAFRLAMAKRRPRILVVVAIHNAMKEADAKVAQYISEKHWRYEK